MRGALIVEWSWSAQSESRVGSTSAECWNGVGRPDRGTSFKHLADSM